MFGMNQSSMNSIQIMNILNDENDDLYINSKSNDDESNDEYIKFFIL